MWLNASIQVEFMCVGENAWAFVHVNERESAKRGKKLAKKPALPKQNTQTHTSRKTRHSQAFRLSIAFMFFTQFLFLKLSLSLSLWGVITVVGSSRVGKRFSFPLSLPPSKLCTGYYRDLFTKCSFCLFLSSPLCPLSLHFSLQFSATPWNSVCLLMYWLMPSSACPLYFFLLVSCLLSLCPTAHTMHTCTQKLKWIIWKYDCVWYWTAVCVRHKWWMSFLIKV